jgi:serine/threonine protein kinase/Tfp pilus assembly protein PilF
MLNETISHYKLLDKCGEGGMGVVYRARDTKLNRTVALKFLPSHIVPSKNERKRFIHEAQSASALDHPNICTIHEIDESPEGQLFIVMSYYEGETLKSKIEQGPLKVEEAVDIAIQVAKGLAKAHTHCIVHRDIKPANIIITKDGVAKIVDFGLAKLGGGTLLTKTGTTIGTVAYMSPEQAQGDNVDHRTDIWSLGVVLYEMITGQRPFRSDYEQALLYLIINGEPDPIPNLRKDISPGLDQIVGHALAKRADDRYRTMDEFREDLASIAEGLKPLKAKVRAHQPEKSIAVLPFINDSPDQENTYFINGVMEEILNNLQKIKDLRVISRTSVEKYRGQNRSISEIAEDLGVNYVVEGSAQKYGNAFRLRAQLIMAEHESHLWGESFQSEINDVKDIFNIQIKIAESIAGELKAVISPDEKRVIEKIPTKDLGAYEDFLKGRFYLYKFTRTDCEIAIKYFESAISKDPDYAPAYANIALSWGAMVQFGFKSPDEAGPFSQESLMKAIELDSNNAEVQYTLAGMRTWGMWDWEGGEEAFKKTLSINPNHAEAHAYYSHYLLNMGRPREEIMKEIDAALKLDPLNPLILSLCAISFFILGKLSESIRLFNDALRIDPDYNLAMSNLGEALYLSGRVEEALEKYKAYYAIMNLHDVAEAIEKGVKEGGSEKAFIYMAEALESKFQADYWVPAEIAWRFVQAGDKNKALDWLEVGYEKRDQNMPYLCWPLFDPIRDEQRFQEIARKMNLPYT